MLTDVNQEANPEHFFLDFNNFYSVIARIVRDVSVQVLADLMVVVLGG